MQNVQTSFQARDIVVSAALAFIAFAGFGIVAPGSANAGGVAENGKEMAAQVCASCHGADGNSGNAQFPKIAGQHESYLANALSQYREGAAPSLVNSAGGIVAKKLSRNNAIMAGFAAKLTDQQIADLAAYFASQKGDLYTPTNWDD